MSNQKKTVNLQGHMNKAIAIEVHQLLETIKNVSLFSKRDAQMNPSLLKRQRSKKCTCVCSDVNGVINIRISIEFIR